MLNAGPVTVGFYLFFAVVFAAYWALPSARSRTWLIVGASYGFYAAFDVRFVALLAVATIVGYVAGRLIESADQARGRLVVAGAIAICLTILGVFKYLGFFAASAQYLLQRLGMGADIPTLKLLLPVGISFYLFKVISYVVDAYRGRLVPTRDPVAFGAYVAFFPQLLAGPIDRAGDLLPQFQDKRVFDHPMAVAGAEQVLWGLFKKLALADGLAWAVGQALGPWESRTAPVLVAGAVLFSFQIYCDFSGYTDIASGLAKLLGITTVRNFAYPYFSQSIAEFWRRWNISVSSWFRDYVYIPLGGSRVVKPRLLLNIMLTFVASGLWHGAGVTFLAWGALLGAGVCADSLLGVKVKHATETPGGDRQSVRSVASMLGTFAFITLSWVFFRAQTMADAMGILSGMLDWSDAAAVAVIPTLFPGTRLLLLVALVGFVIVEWLARRRECPLALPVVARGWRWAAYSVVIWLTVLLMQPLSGVRFLYFDF